MLLFIALGLLIWSIILSIKIPRTFHKWNQVRALSGITGAEAARRILNANGIYDVAINTIPGSLSDHYDPRSKTLNLSIDVANNASVGALAVAAHECGHAIQHHEGYSLLKFRNSLVPVANIGSNLGIWLCILGFAFSFVAFLIPIGILLFAFAVIFHVVTLPVELNASKRAMALLENGYMLQTYEETQGAKKMLSAAAMTYVAAALASVIQLLRLIGGSQN